jgi:hypothetical protein
LKIFYINDERYTVILNILENISMVHQSGILLPFFFEKDRHITLFRFPKKDADQTIPLNTFFPVTSNILIQRIPFVGASEAHSRESGQAQASIYLLLEKESEKGHSLPSKMNKL